MAAKYAPKILPSYFSDSKSFRDLALNSAVNEKERFVRLYNLIKEKTGKDKIIFVLDEVGQYVASNVDLIPQYSYNFHDILQYPAYLTISDFYLTPITKTSI